MIEFRLEPQEETKALEFQRTHICSKLDSPDQPGVQGRGALGERYLFIFVPTDYGTVKKLQCVCGAECDVTDYSQIVGGSW